MALGSKLLPFLAAVSCLSSGAALAQTACGSAIDQLTRQHNLTMEAPQSTAPSQSATEAAPPATLESRGLTATQPPPDSTGAFTPPPAPGSTAAAPPAVGSGSTLAPPQTLTPGAGAAQSDLNAADRGRMEALLKAARDAERRGDNAHCLELLREAQATPGVSGAGAPK